MTITVRELATKVAKMRAAQQRGHGRRIYFDCHDATITKEYEAEIDRVVAEMLTTAPEEQEAVP